MRGQGGRRVGQGFTIAEVLVVVLIIGLLMALLLPALGRALSVSRRAQCASRMRQIGLAIRQYELKYHYLPAGNLNLVPQLRPIFGQVDAATGDVTEVYRCPQDPYVSLERMRQSISYAPLEGGATNAGRLHCGWSLFESGRLSPRAGDNVAPDTAILCEYWAPGNLANATSLTPGWRGNTMDWDGARCPLSIPPAAGVSVGGYRFLDGFDNEAERRNVSLSLNDLMHIGSINLTHADGSVSNYTLRTITDTAPKDRPLWTAAAD